MQTVIDPLYCSWDTSSKLLIFSDNVFGNFVYYSHLLPVVCVAAFIILLLTQNRRDPVINSLVVIAIAFTCWSFTDLVLWATANSDYTMFFWSIIIHFELLIYFGALYFIYYYIEHRPPHWALELLALLAYLPVALFAHTELNLTAFDYTNCLREALEGPLLAYVYALELLIATWILAFGIRHVFKAQTRSSSKEYLLATAGTFFFLFSFSFGNIIGSLEVDWELGQYGLFAIPVFIGLLTYLIIKYKGINVKLFSTEVLIVSILVLVSSILFVQTIENVQVITAFTIALIAILGVLLVKSVKREIAQREKIEDLAKNLERANKRLKELDKLKNEFVSVASHQLRSPLTAIRGYSSMILEGSFGPVPKKMNEPLERIVESSAFMASSVEDYLSVSRIESGNMKYNCTDFNLATETEKIVDDLRRTAIKKGLILTFKSDLKKKGIVNCDLGKTEQIIHNLLTNSIKYTPKGTIVAFVHDDVKKKEIYLDIIDTGIGMSKESIANLFGKFVRAANAHTINANGTGLGLYIAREMANKMHGDITASSDGEGQGSTFRFKLPLQM